MQSLRFKREPKTIRILVVGDVMIDHYFNGVFERISPEAPVPIVDVHSEFETLGGAGNVLENVLALGAKVDLLSVIGDDQVGNDLHALLQKHSINLAGIIKEKGRNTTKKSRVMVAKHQMLRIDKESKHPIAEESELAMLKFLEERISDYDLLLVSDYGKGVLSNSFLQGLFSIARKHNKPSLVDPKGLDYSKYKGANLIKPNRKEAGLATGINITNEDALLKAMHKLQEITACEQIVVTLSEEGMAVLEKDIHKIPTKANEVFDVTGAGDTVLACLGIGMASGMDIIDACHFANHAAAIVVSRVGSATTTIDEIAEHIKLNTHV